MFALFDLTNNELAYRKKLVILTALTFLALC